MVHEVRIYGFNEGQAARWLTAFLETLVPLYHAHGVKVPGVWRDPARNQVVWFRVFRDLAHQKSGHAAVVAAPEFQAMARLFRETGIAVVDERNLVPVLQPRFQRGDGLHELRIYGVKDGRMDEWVQLFFEKVKPSFEAHGVEVPGAWRDDVRNQFLWFRVFEDREELERVHKAVIQRPEWQEWLRGPFDDVGAVVLETRHLIPVFRPQFD